MPLHYKIDMQQLGSVVFELDQKLNKLKDTTSKGIKKLIDALTPLEDYVMYFTDRWEGGWGQEDYNYYRGLPPTQEATYELNEGYIKAYIKNEWKIDIDVLSQSVYNTVKAYKEFNNELLPCLSIIRDYDKFKAAVELLDKLEDFTWGFHASELIELMRPKAIMVHPRQINKGLQIPPHISVMATCQELITKCGACNNYYDDVKRLLRQIEVKIKIKAESNNHEILSTIFDRFHKVANQLKNRHANRETINISDEYDVQDIIRSLLTLHFDDIREEEYAPSYAGGASRIDFLLKKEEIIIEVKKTRNTLKDKEIGSQLLIDIARYEMHPDCKELYCFVYDPESLIKNPIGLENDLAKQSKDTMDVKVFIRP